MITCFSCLPLFDFTCSLSLCDSDFCSWRISYKIITVMMEGVINLYCHGFINLIKICPVSPAQLSLLTHFQLQTCNKNAPI